MSDKVTILVDEYPTAADRDTGTNMTTYARVTTRAELETATSNITGRNRFPAYRTADGGKLPSKAAALALLPKDNVVYVTRGDPE